jgi:2,3-bisphosphoglycerate-independent phosphoglycerate mutase
MKGILIIVDGMGDLPCKQLENKTPLEYAKTPNLDLLTKNSKMGVMNSVKKGHIPSSDEAIISIFRNDLSKTSRGKLEAIGSGIKTKNNELAVRINFATIDSKGKIIDRRAGRTLTTKEAKILSKTINKIKLPCEFKFKSTIQHRGVLILYGKHSDEIIGNDPSKLTKKIPVKPKNKNAKYTANILNEFLEKLYNALKNHRVNKERIKKGLAPANYILLRGAGIKEPKLKQYKNWISPSYMPLEIGFSKKSAMTITSFKYPELKKTNVYENLWDGLKKICDFGIKSIKKYYKKYGYMYLHIKEPDIPGHDNKPLEKKAMIEYIDKTLFKFLKNFAPLHKIDLVITADHSTPCRLKSHSANPVPVLFYSNKLELKSTKKFCEKNAKKGELKEFRGRDLFKKVGFLK